MAFRRRDSYRRISSIVCWVKAWLFPDHSLSFKDIFFKVLVIKIGKVVFCVGVFVSGFVSLSWIFIIKKMGCIMINNRIFNLLALVTLSTTAGTALADPIGDNAFVGKKVGWFPSSQTSCRTVCLQQNGAVAEYEKFSGPTWGNTATFVCKGTASVAGPWGGQGWLYGNNFNAATREKVCIVSDAAGGAQRLQNFFCLCVL